VIVKAEPVRAPSPPHVEEAKVLFPEQAASAPEAETPIVDHTVSSSTISTLKKELKRLANQRAIAVAARLSGPSQDEQLKAEEARLARIEAEMADFRSLLQKGETKLPTEAIKSEFLVLNREAKGFAIEALVSRLEGYRASSKDKVAETHCIDQ
jgi:hypothetical protein